MATTRTQVGKTNGSAVAVHVLNDHGDTFNEEEGTELGEKDWRQVFVEFPQVHSTAPVILPSRSSFPEIAWVDVSGLMEPERWIPNIVALRGTIVDFRIDPSTNEEEVDIEIHLFPAQTELLEMLRQGAIADKLFTACIRAVNLFPRERVEEGSSFIACISMGYQRDQGPDTTSDRLNLTKVVWDLKVSGPLTKQNGWTITKRFAGAWKHWREGSAVWEPSSSKSELYSPAEASLVMDLHLVLSQLWQAQFGRREELNAQLRAQASQRGHLGVVRSAHGKSSMRPWTGPDLFPQR
ncbi:hypothetical protein HZA87_01215 [Candidatus Uhrbacteria bacterium]|nr:hypothetical protein [Candidatus Uhrbacteria bacterium]